MKRVIALILCLVMVVCVIASCGEPGEAHSHTYSETWSWDAEGHWYKATCDCEDATEKKLTHTDKNNDGACDVCEYKMACADGHSYSEDWTVDCTNHWNAADCGHIVAGANVAAHADANNDGECDVCKYVINDIHTHYYDTAWTGDSEYHWHAALCEHGVEVADKAAHELNAAGYCTVCDAKINEVDLTDIEKVLAAAAARNDKVTGANVDYVNTIPDIDVVQTHSVYFILGTDSAYVKRIQYDAAVEFWYEYISEEEVFGVTSYDGGLTLVPEDGSIDDLNGYTYMPSTLADATTLDGILSALYELTKADTAKDVVVDYDAETGVYSFSYEYLFVDVITGSGSMTDSGNDDSTADSVSNVVTSLFTVDAKFEIDDNFVINAAEFVVGAYNQDIDGDYVYNVEDGTYTMSDGALADTYAYKVAQSSGERKYYTAYPKAAVVPHDFDLLLPNGDVAEDEIKVTAGTYVELTLGNLVPFSAQVSCLNPENMSIVIANKENPDDTLYAFYWNGSIGFNPSTEGEYTITITYEEIVKTYDLVVTAPAPTSVTMYGFEWIQGYDSEVYTADVYNPGPTSMIVLEPGQTFDFAVLCSPNAADQAVTVTVDSTDATVTTVELEDVVVFYEMLETYNAYQFKSDVVGTYKITLTSVANPDVTTTVTAYVGTEPADDENVSTTLNFSTPGNFAKTSQEFIAPVAGTYVITAEGLDASTWLQIDRYDPINDTDWTKIQGQLPYSIELEAGEMLTVRLYGWSNDAAIVGTPVAVTIALDNSGSGAGDAVTEGAGTEDSPYVIPATGDYTCEFPGGCNATWYSFTADKNGYVTVSTTFETGWIQVGTTVYNAGANANGGDGAPVKFLVNAGQTIVIGIADWNEGKATIPFSVAFEEVEFKDVAFLAGNWAGTETAMWGSQDYIFSLNADGTGLGYYTDDWGKTTFTVESVIYVENDIIINISSEYSSASITFVYAEVEGNKTLTTDSGLMDVELVLTPYDGDVSFEEEVVESELIIGNNQIEAADVNFNYTATEAGKLTLTTGAAIMGMVEISYTVNGGDSQMLDLSSSVEIDLAAGDVVVVTVIADGYSSITADWAAAPSGDEDSAADVA